MTKEKIAKWRGYKDKEGEWGRVTISEEEVEEIKEKELEKDVDLLMKIWKLIKEKQDEEDEYIPADKFVIEIYKKFASPFNYRIKNELRRRELKERTKEERVR